MYALAVRAWFLAPLLFVSACAAAAQPVTLANPSFEQLDADTAMPAHWQPWSKDTVAAYTLARAHSGVASLLITDDSPTIGHGVRSDPVAIKAGTTYAAAGYVYIDELKAGGFAIYLEYWDKSGARILDRSVATNVPGKWVRLDVAATAPPAAVTATVLCYGASITVGTACFDDMMLEEKKQ